MIPVSHKQLQTAVGGRLLTAGAVAGDLLRVFIDSRNVRPGDVFWAIKGDNHDGHDFVDAAFRQGAGLCVVEQNIPQHAAGTLLQVEDTLAALGNFAAWYRQQLDALIVGVTGSFGKTTTREMIHAAMSTKFSGTRSPKNYNNHFGLPLSLLEISDTHEFAVVEMGASHVGEIRDLAKIAQPEIGVITGIGLAHLEGFGTAERIIEAKGELLDALPTSGFAVVGGDDPVTRNMARRACCPVILVGTQEHNHVRAQNIHSENGCLRFAVDKHEYKINVAGRHQVNAALSAIAIGREVGLNPSDIAEGLRLFQPADGRCQIEQIGLYTIINDAYNASPESMQAACQTLHEWTGANQRILIVGDMLELGTQSAALHESLGRSAASLDIDYLLAYGTNAKHVVRGAQNAGMPGYALAECDNFDAVPTVLDCCLEPGDVVLVKGSRATQMERIIEWIRHSVAAEFGAHYSRPLERACA